MGHAVLRTPEENRGMNYLYFHGFVFECRREMVNNTEETTWSMMLG